MSDDTFPAPDLALVLGPSDTAIYVGEAPPRKRRRSFERDTLYVVVHRGTGLWTHVYRVSQDRRPHHQWVFLERVYEGDRTAEACAWARGTSGGSRSNQGEPAP